MLSSPDTIFASQNCHFVHDFRLALLPAKASSIESNRDRKRFQLPPLARPLDLMLHCQTVPDLIITHQREFYSRPTLEVARDLLGAVIYRRLDSGELLSGRILEVEAYTQDDPACHAFKGKTERCKIMFGPAGYVYVYFIYGMYWCLNVVTEPDQVPGAILIRAVETPHGNGPGKLCRAWEIDRKHYGEDVCDPSSSIFIARSERLADSEVETSTRIGLNVGQDRVWRFFIKEHDGVSGIKRKKSTIGSAAVKTSKVG